MTRFLLFHQLTDTTPCALGLVGHRLLVRVCTMPKANHLAGVIEVPDVCLVLFEDTFARLFDRALDLEEGDDQTGTLSKRIDGNVMNL